MIDNVEIKDKSHSTNEELKERILLGENFKDGFVLACNEQTYGRGRLGRDFFSPRGGIYFSIVFKDTNYPFLSFMPLSALLISQLLEKTFNIYPKIKWINDILIDRKKLAGILAQKVSNYIIIGIGLNYNIKEFPSDLADKTISLFYNNPPIRLENFREEMIKTFRQIPSKSNTDWITEYKKRSSILNKEINIVQMNGKIIKSGTVIDFTKEGYLIINANGTNEKIFSGEVSVRVN